MISKRKPLKNLGKKQIYLLFSFLGGVCMGISPAPNGFWWLAWGAIAPLWFFLERHPFDGDPSTPLPNPPLTPLPTPPPKDRRTFTRVLPYRFFGGFVWGIGYHGIALFWLTGLHPMTWMGVPWLASLAIALFCWLFVTCWGAVLPGVWALGLIPIARCAPWLRVLWGTALWCLLEWFWSLFPLWWTSLSLTQSPANPVILHLGRLSGPLAVTAAIAAVNGAIAAVLPHWRKQPFAIAVPLALYLSCYGCGWWLWQQPLADAPDRALHVGLIQGNVPNEIKLYSEGWERAIDRYTQGYRRLARDGVQAVLTPETALPFLWSDRTKFDYPFYRAVREEKVLAWVGGFGDRPRSSNQQTNSLFALSGTGEITGRYDKAILVPLGEYIPFERWLGGFIDRLSPLKTRLVAGSPEQIFETPFGRAIVGICYESAFARHFRRQAARGGEFLLTASNNAHYAPAMPAQHHAQDVLRAIETDRWAARATNTGYSAIVDPHGRARWISGLNTYETHADTIYRRQTRTLYVRWGDWLTPLLVAIAIAARVARGVGAIALRAGREY